MDAQRGSVKNVIACCTHGEIREFHRSLLIDNVYRKGDEKARLTRDETINEHCVKTKGSVGLVRS